MPTCECCNKTIKDGQRMEHWICEDCKVGEEEKQSNQTNQSNQSK